MDLNFQIASKENELKSTLKKAVFIQKELELLRKLRKLHAKKEEISFSKPILRKMLQNATDQSQQEENDASKKEEIFISNPKLKKMLQNAKTILQKEENVGLNEVENEAVTKKTKQKTKKKKKGSKKKKKKNDKSDIIKLPEEL